MRELKEQILRDLPGKLESETITCNGVNNSLPAFTIKRAALTSGPLDRSFNRDTADRA